MTNTFFLGMGEMWSKLSFREQMALYRFRCKNGPAWKDVMRQQLKNGGVWCDDCDCDAILDVYKRLGIQGIMRV